MREYNTCNIMSCSDRRNGKCKVGAYRLCEKVKAYNQALEDLLERCKESSFQYSPKSKPYIKIDVVDIDEVRLAVSELIQ